MQSSLTTGLVRATAIASAVLLVTILTLTRSQAVFTATAGGASSSFSTGSVALTDDDTGSALFAASGMSPGTPEVACVEVTYSGTIVPASIRLHGSTTGTLPQYLDTTIEVGVGGSFGNCTGFTPSSVVFAGTLDAFSTAHSNYASGLGLFTAGANPTARTVRISIEVQNVAAAQDQTANADFVFETQA